MIDASLSLLPEDCSNTCSSWLDNARDTVFTYVWSIDITQPSVANRNLIKYCMQMWINEFVESEAI